MDKIIKGIFFLFLPLLVITQNEAALDDALFPRFLVASGFSFILLIFLVWKKHEFVFPKNELIIWLIIYGTVISNGLFFTDNNYFQFVIAKLNLLFSIHVLAINLFNINDHKKVFYWSVFTALIVLQIKVISQLIGTEINEFKDVFQINGGFGHKNILSAVVFTLTLLSINIWKNIKSIWIKYMAIIVFAISLSIIGLLQTRSIWLSLIIVVIGGGWSNYKLLLKNIKPLGFGIVVTAGIISGFLFNNQSYFNTVHEKIVVTSDTKAFESVDERLFLWGNSVELFKDNLLLGVGSGNWKRDYLVYGISGSRAENGMTNFLRPHNDFLWISTEYGIIGSVLFAFVFGYILVKKRKGISILLLLVPVTLFVFSMFSFPIERPYILVIFIFTISLMYSSIQKNKWIPYACILILGFSLNEFYTHLNASIISEKVIESYRDLNNKKLIKYVNELEKLGITIDEQGTSDYWYKGVAQSNLGQTKKALASFKSAYKDMPNHVHVINNLASSYYMLGQNNEAEKLYKKGLKISTGFDELYINYAAMLFNEKRFSEALIIINNCPENSKHPNYKKFYNVINSKVDKPQ